MLDDATRTKTLGRLRRIEGQVQGLQRMIGNDAYCVDILLQISAVQGALEQVQKLLLGRHVETCVADAFRAVRAKRTESHGHEIVVRAHPEVVSYLEGDGRDPLARLGASLDVTITVNATGAQSPREEFQLQVR